MATLSILFPLPATFERSAQSLHGRHFWCPACSKFQFLVAVTCLLPFGVPTAPIEDRWQLPARPSRIPLPKRAEYIADRMRHIDGFETPDVLLVVTQELATRGEVI